MNDTRLTTGQRFLMQAGAIGAVLGAILQVAAGTGSTSLPSGEPAAVLRELAGSAGGWWQIDDFDSCSAPCSGSSRSWPWPTR